MSWNKIAKHKNKVICKEDKAIHQKKETRNVLNKNAKNYKKKQFLNE